MTGQKLERQVALVTSGVAIERAKSQSWPAKAIPNIPKQLAAELKDIAEVIAFLSSPANRFITGETVIANGGGLIV